MGAAPSYKARKCRYNNQAMIPQRPAHPKSNLVIRAAVRDDPKLPAEKERPQLPAKVAVK